MHKFLKFLQALTERAGSMETIGCEDNILSHLSNPFLLASAKSESTPLTNAENVCGGKGGNILFGKRQSKIS